MISFEGSIRTVSHTCDGFLLTYLHIYLVIALPASGVYSSQGSVTIRSTIEESI